MQQYARPVPLWDASMQHLYATSQLPSYSNLESLEVWPSLRHAGLAAGRSLHHRPRARTSRCGGASVVRPAKCAAAGRRFYALRRPTSGSLSGNRSLLVDVFDRRRGSDVTAHVVAVPVVLAAAADATAAVAAAAAAVVIIVVVVSI
eukprot:257926-Chlamydomonas_euryale.AAC.4